MKSALPRTAMLLSGGQKPALKKVGKSVLVFPTITIFASRIAFAPKRAANMQEKGRKKEQGQTVIFTLAQACIYTIPDAYMFQFHSILGFQRVKTCF